MGFFSDLFGNIEQSVSSSSSSNNDGSDMKFAFMIGKLYKLDDLKKFLITATGYAQNIIGCEVTGAVKSGMEETVFDPRLRAQLPDGREEPLFSFLYTSIVQSQIGNYQGKNRNVTPVARVSFSQSPKTCRLEFNNTQIWESSSLTYALVPPRQIVMISAFKIDNNKTALLQINYNKTFHVVSISNDSGGFSAIKNGVSDENSNKMPDLVSEFGTSIDNPICLRSVSEEYSYLNMLKCSSKDEQIIDKVRLGSLSHNGVIYDKWKISIKNFRLNVNENIIIYMNPYSRNSDFGKAPNRFDI